jgi:hypothetical protein
MLRAGRITALIAPPLRNHPCSKGRIEQGCSPRSANKTTQEAIASSFATRGFREGRRGDDDQIIMPAHENRAGMTIWYLNGVKSDGGVCLKNRDGGAGDIFRGSSEVRF